MRRRRSSSAGGRPLAALYHRVSTIDQDPALAREELLAVARARRWAVAFSVEETGSGARTNRPGLERILSAARRREIDVVAVWKLDRFGRSFINLVSNIEELQRLGVRFVCITQRIEVGAPGEHPASELFIKIGAAFAEFERTQIAERTRLAIASRRRRGLPLGRPVSPDAPTRAHVASLRAAGTSWAAVAKKLRCTVAAARRAMERTTTTTRTTTTRRT